MFSRSTDLIPKDIFHTSATVSLWLILGDREMELPSITLRWKIALRKTRVLNNYYRGIKKKDLENSNYLNLKSHGIHGFGWDIQCLFINIIIFKAQFITKRTCHVWLSYLYLSGSGAALSLGCEPPRADVTFLFIPIV